MTATKLFPYDEYYGHPLVFKVEDVYFTAFKMAFTRPGSFFESIFSLPKLGSQPSTEGVAEGSSPENPITLHGISKKNFRNLLRVLCPFEGIPPCNNYDEWIGVLDLATMWDFQTIRATAISNITPFLESIPVIDRILIARKYEVKAWLVDALARAASKPINRREFKVAGVDLDTINGLFAIRDTAMQGEIGIIRRGTVEWCNTCHHTHLDIDLRPFNRLDADWLDNFGVIGIVELKRLVRREFAEELADMRND